MFPLSRPISNSADLLRLSCGQPVLEKPLGWYALRSFRSLGGFKFLRCYFSHFDRISYLVCFYVRYNYMVGGGSEANVGALDDLSDGVFQRGGRLTFSLPVVRSP